VIEVVGLSKRYGDVLAVDDIYFSVAAGEVVGFLGPNGAGKSTTLRMLTGYLAPTSGRALVAGHDIVEQSLAARRALGYMPETCPLYPELRVEEFLGFRARLKHVPRRELRQKVTRAMQRAGIYERRGALIGQLSRGLRQRVGLADALVAEPPLLVLDEPTAGLDPNQIREVRELVRELRDNHTVLLSTHILTEVEMTCDRVVMLSRGRVVASGTLHELRKDQTEEAELTIERTAELDQKTLEKVLGECAGVLTFEPNGSVVVCRVSLTTPALGVAPLLGKLLGAGLGVREAALRRTSLEDLFARLTRDAEGNG
jgi:ABC-2 type transport system ATP-binding protein